MKGFFVVSPFKRQLFKNTSVQIAAYGAGILFSLATTAVLSRHLGITGFGHFNYVFAFFFFFLSLSDFGLNSIVLREISKSPEKQNEILGSMVLYKFLIGTVMMGAAWILILRVSYPEQLKTILMIYALTLPFYALQMPSLIFHAQQKFEYLAGAGFLAKLAGFLLILVSVWRGHGVIAAVCAVVFQEILLSVLLWLSARKFVTPKLLWNPALWKAILKSSAILGLAGICGAVINRADFVMLERIRDLKEVGYYAATYKVTNLLEALALMFMNSIFPLMSRSAQTDPERLKQLYFKSTVVLSAAGIAAGLLISTVANPLMKWICGAEFEAAGDGLRVLVWATVFLYGSLSGGNFLIAVHRERTSLFINLAAAVLNLCLNFLWIPEHGYIGASAATAVSFGFMWLATTVAVYQSKERFHGFPA